VSRSLQRLLAAAGLTVAVGATGIGCPSRDLTVEITREGADTLAFACEIFRDACRDKKACLRNKLLCEARSNGSICKLRQACEVPGNPEWDATVTMGVQLAIAQVTEEKGIGLRRRSACVPLNLRRCLRDPDALAGCPDGAEDTEACFTEAVAAAVRRAVGGGMTFDGFDDPAGVVFAALFFRKPGDEMSCDPDVVVSPDVCAVGNLVAAAGLAAPIGGSTYDVTCTSCQSGPRTSLGRDNGACPVTGDQCFLQRVAALLAASRN